MRFFSLPALLAAALVSAVVALPFLPLAKNQQDLFRLEARVSTNTAGKLQVFLDAGGGWSEELSARTTLTAGGVPVTHRLPFAPGRYRALRFDPLDHGGTVTLHALRLVTKSGRVIADFPLEKFTATQQVEALRLREGALEITIASTSNDPQLGFVFPELIDVSAAWTDYLPGSLRTVALIFIGLADRKSVV